MPSTYAPPGHKAKLVPPHHTICHVIVGPGTPFEKGVAVRLADGFPDGTSETLLFVEAGAPVPWTKPEEIAYDPTAALPQLRGLFKDGYRAGTASGERRFVRHDVGGAEFRALITRNGGEGPSPDSHPNRDGPTP